MGNDGISSPCKDGCATFWDDAFRRKAACSSLIQKLREARSWNEDAVADEHTAGCLKQRATEKIKTLLTRPIIVAIQFQEPGCLGPPRASCGVTEHESRSLLSGHYRSGKSARPCCGVVNQGARGPFGAFAKASIRAT